VSDRLRDALLEIQGTCQEVAHEVEDPTRAIAEIEATTRKALRAKAEPVVPLSEVREALLSKATIEALAKDRATNGVHGAWDAYTENRKAEWCDEAQQHLEEVADAFDTALASTDSEAQG
jgi:hypothetical protein